MIATFILLALAGLVLYFSPEARRRRATQKQIRKVRARIQEKMDEMKKMFDQAP